MNCELDLDEYILKFGQIHFAIQTNTNAVPRNEIWMQAVQALEPDMNCELDLQS